MCIASSFTSSGSRRCARRSRTRSSPPPARRSCRPCGCSGRSAPRRSNGRPSWPPGARPRLRSSVVAASMSPLASVSAALHSIMPAPVASRSVLHHRGRNLHLTVSCAVLRYRQSAGSEIVRSSVNRCRPAPVGLHRRRLYTRTPASDAWPASSRNVAAARPTPGSWPVPARGRAVGARAAAAVVASPSPSSPRDGLADVRGRR